MTLIFATNNQHKADEIRAVLPAQLTIMTLKEAGITIDIPEPHPTLHENAREKAVTIFQLTGTDCFSEDTGLEVLSLHGEPGVKSARYAGDTADSQQNISKLLTNLSGVQDRQARFRTVICLLLNGQEHFFEGTCQGSITEVQKGKQGFGYDAVFVPEGASRTFAEMNLEEKAEFSHRSKAVRQLGQFLNNLNTTNKEN